MGRQPKGEEIPKPKVIYIQDEQNAIRKLLTYCVHGNVVLEGSKSLGKNVAWETVSWLLNRKSFMLSCGEGLTMSTIFGFLSTDNSAIDGLTEEELKIMYDNEAEGKVDNEAKARVMLKVFQNMSPKLVLSQGVVTEALLWENAGYGALLILDEMNMADPNILAQSFNTLTDKHAPTIHVDTYGNVPIPSTFLMGATQNGTGGAYFGTQMQNDATMSRWSVIRLRNSKSIKSALMGADRAGEVEEEVLDMLDNVFRAFQNQVSLGNAPEGCLNLRGFKQAVNAIALGIDRVSAIEDCVLNSLPESTSIQTLRSILDEYVE
jgi:MoxR-like ATPase